jgi:hypothetical protein
VSAPTILPKALIVRRGVIATKFPIWQWGVEGADDIRYASAPHFVAASVAASSTASACAILPGSVRTPWRPLITFVHSDAL